MATVVLVLGAVYVAGYLLAGDRAPRNASVGGVPIGGLPREEAVATLEEQLAPRADAPITLSAGDTVEELLPEEVGLSIDSAASVEESGAGRSWDPTQIWQVLTGGSEREPVTRVDEARVAEAVAAFAEGADGEPEDATLAYEGTEVQVEEASTGVTVDQQATVEQLVEAYPRSTTVEATAEVTQPDVTTEEAEQVAEEVAEPAVSAPVEVEAGDAGTFEVSPESIAAATTFEVAEGGYVARYDAEKLLEGNEEAVEELDTTRAKDAYWTLEGGTPELVEAVDGTSVGADALLEAVRPVLTTSGSERKASVELTEKKAEFTTEDAEKAKVTEVTGEFTTRFPVANGGEYRNTNLGQVAKRIDGYWLAPGETFSMNGVVGERSAENGFVDGYVIQGGVLKKESGGGVSQGATTIFNAAFFAGLEDVEHHPHTLYFPRYPPGREATVYYGSLDLRFKNDTPYGVVIEADRVPGSGSKQGSLTVKIWSTPVYDEIRSPDPEKSDFTSGRRLESDDPECEYQAPIQGFTADFHRAFIQDGKEVKRENYTWTYDPGDEIVCE
ncbi:Vancomycin resistance protein YoaR, contains peptidoglycan-binding and VanW domains [Auraticoccus monumenti]|uniref:Vancomycin resistance protein YoaR, contains peptidoglycan-binding and VanW domains n=1 Tax=Auraticoccus monumenti TaxID=675864 RepID=A0A1G7A8Y0_9ACTN|nr:Vancomycin resistance protein YoaR, contains peptidoglycan-binding and VanW domains [Auraticoccus monumenti]